MADKKDSLTSVSDAATLVGDAEKSVSDSESQDDINKSLPLDHPAMFPDGGTKAWLCVAGSAAAFFCSFGWTNCMGIFQDYYLKGPLNGYQISTVSWITSCEIFFMFGCGPIAGMIFDNFGERWLLIIGTFLHVFGLMMASISTKYYQFLLSQGVCSAIGASFILSCATTCTATWFAKYRGRAFGIVAAGSSIGGVLFPVIVSKAIPEIGFGWTMRLCAFLILGLMIFANFTMTSRILPTKKSLDPAAFFRPFSELPFTLICLALFAFYWGMFIPFEFIVSDARAHGMSLQLSQYLVSITNAGSIFGRTLPGYIADRVGRFNTMVAMCVFTGVLILALWIPASSNAALIVFAPLFGFGSGAAIGLSPALIAQISDVREIGVRSGTLFGFAAFAALTSAPIGGSLYNAALGTNSFEYTKIWSGCCCLIGALLFATARVRLSGWTIHSKT